ncbi:hypothetical protein KZO01_06580 [Kurthia zopfii]|uniref:Phage-Barnase-EndoU-ColicinE5/D-RelE like nuclease 4 domain-containing protein n=1 Tax=Kurthia zopfii TaxID=1650 RepID=A0A8B4Q958_9BACL|nr:PBECR4 domain-containing protein [Kurthia zopfii]PWI23475.1 hypothetical protein DF281_02735 [Kurthia zopfii]TDR39789.1 hypothetical protein DFR61_1104 [Kurthia zopfii]GEK30349.1 hypothetical protein KZO01_06580 [Kurthia zopfii]STX09238.1 Uncharacterised protein [Kurthia zopfii]
MSNLIIFADEFASSTTVPTADQLSLKLIIEYYDEFLEPYLFSYRTKENDLTINLKFSKAHAPHLIGMHYAPNIKYGRNSSKANKFKGFSGYSGVKSGSITKQTIKDILPKKPKYYKDMTKKMRYFFCLHTVLENPEGIYYNKEINSRSSNIDCDIILYKSMYGQIIHLGLVKAGDQYAPKTMLVEAKTYFIDGQTPIEIQKTEKSRHKRAKD